MIKTQQCYNGKPRSSMEAGCWENYDGEKISLASRRGNLTWRSISKETNPSVAKTEVKKMFGIFFWERFYCMNSKRLKENRSGSIISVHFDFSIFENFSAKNQTILKSNN